MLKTPLALIAPPRLLFELVIAFLELLCGATADCERGASGLMLCCTGEKVGCGCGLVDPPGTQSSSSDSTAPNKMNCFII
jgi:hypothetical protein